MATALITGGTSGIGAAFARALAARGDDLVLVARNADRLAETATEMKERYAVNVEEIVADLAIRSDVVGVAERLASVEQPIDLLVSNAGFGVPAKLTEADTTPHEHAGECTRLCLCSQSHVGTDPQTSSINTLFYMGDDFWPRFPHVRAMRRSNCQSIA